VRIIDELMPASKDGKTTEDEKVVADIKMAEKYQS